MRISDWSSDVCSSDLGRDGGCGGAAQAVAELSERHRPEHRLRAAALQGRELVEGVRSDPDRPRSEEHTSELQSLMRNSYAVFCLKKKKNRHFKSNATLTILQDIKDNRIDNCRKI